MAEATENMFTEAIAAARAGDRVRARDLLTRLLRAESTNADYWVWMSSVVDSARERKYCLESALQIDSTNRAALRGLIILGHRSPDEIEIRRPARIPRRQMASIAKSPTVGGGLRINWTMIGATIGGVVVIIGVGAAAAAFFGILGPRRLQQASLLPTEPPTPTDTPLIPTATATLIPAAERVLRTPIPTELVGTPFIFFVKATPTVTPVYGERERSSYEAYSAGISALISGNYQEAVSFFDQVLELDDSLADVHHLKGESLRLLALKALANEEENIGSMLGQAVNAYDQAILADSEFAPAYLGRGRALLQRVYLITSLDNLKADDLPQDFQRAIDRDPQHAEPYLEMASFYASIRLWKTAEEVLTSAVDAGVREPAVYIFLSEAQLSRQRNVPAVENAIEGSASDHADLHGYLILGRALNRIEEYSASLAPLQTYVAYRGEDHRGWAALGRAQRELFDYTAASLSLNRALEINDRYAPAYLARGLLNLDLGLYDEGLADLNNAQRYGPLDYDLHVALGRAQYFVGNYGEALDHANIAIELGNAEEFRSELERKVAEGYAIRALVYETNEELVSDAIQNWEWILGFNHVKIATWLMAEEHLLALAGAIPTRGPTPTPIDLFATSMPTATITPTPSPTVDMTPITSPTVDMTQTPTPTSEQLP